MPSEEHNLKRCRHPAPLKIPATMATAICKNKDPQAPHGLFFFKPFAEKYIKHGFSCLPVQKNKHPKRGCKWKEEIPIDEFTTHGIAIKCGRPSGGLECIDFDNHFGDAEKNFNIFIKSIQPVYDKYDFSVETTQSGGYHLLYKCNIHGANQKLAQRLKNGIPVAIIEIRGDGGYFVVDPTPGYKFIKNGIEKMPRITREDRKILLDAARSFNEYEQPDQKQEAKPERIWSHNLENRRYRAPLKIPKGMATIICQDKTLLKHLSIYFTLKPLYYSGIITNAKARYAEIAEYIGISPSNLRYKLAWLKKHKLVRFDHKRNLYLCSSATICDFINKRCSINFKKRKCYELLNEGQTECRIRTLAVHESRLKQKNAVEAKVFSKERWDEMTVKMMKKEKKWSDWIDELMQEGVSPDEAWDRYHQHITKITYKNRTLRKEKRMRLNFYKQNAPTDVNLLNRYEKSYEQQKAGAELPGISPHLTLSCSGLARLFGTNTASNGNYWQRKLEDMGFLNISRHALMLKKGCTILQKSIRGHKGWYDAVTDERVPIYTRTTRKGEVLYFLTLPNRLLPLLNTSAMLPGGKYERLCV